MDRGLTRATPEPRLRDALARRDPAAWHEVRNRLTSFVSHRVSNRHDVDDIVQAVLVRIDSSIDTVQDDALLSGWMFQVARNAVVDFYRSSGRRREEPRSALPEPGLLEHGPDNPSARTRRELASCLEPLLRSLDPKYRQALELTELGGLTQAEAADRVGVSVPGMKSRVQRARRQLASLYHEHCRVAFDARNAPLDCQPRPAPEADGD